MYHGMLLAATQGSVLNGSSGSTRAIGAGSRAVDDLDEPRMASSGGERSFRGRVDRYAPRLLDHLIGTGEQQLRHCQIQRLGGFQIDDQLERRRLLEWELGGVFAFQNPINVVGGFALHRG